MPDLSLSPSKPSTRLQTLLYPALASVFAALADRMGEPRLAAANTALEAHQICPAMAEAVAADVQARIARQLPKTAVDVVVIDRAGAILARAEE